MRRLTIEDIRKHNPDVILPPDPEFLQQYWDRVDHGRQQAKRLRVAFVAICRNSMPFIQMTLSRVEQTAMMFRDWKCFLFENDSTDGTKEFIAEAVRKNGRIAATMQNNGRPHLNMTKASERTLALAEYRNACREWVASNARNYDYVVVFDSDPWGGWSIDGIANSLGWLEDYDNDLDDHHGGWCQDWGAAAGMASYSWCQWALPQFGNVPMEAHYDAWACRWNHYNARSELWFHLWHPPVGSEPVRMNSAFGQLAVYRTPRYLEGVYRGGDCEHVSHWRTCGGDCYLNPSQRVVSFWTLEDNGESEGGGVHSDLHETVAERDADPDHCRNSEDIG